MINEMSNNTRSLSFQKNNLKNQLNEHFVRKFVRLFVHKIHYNVNNDNF